MNYEEFKNELVKEIENRMPEYKATFGTVNKIGESYEAITVTPEGGKIGINLNIQKIWADADNHSLESIIDSTISTIKDGFKNQPDINVREILDYDIMKEKLIVNVVSGNSRNEAMLENIPHKSLLDMEIVYRFMVSDNSTILVTNAMLETMGVTPEELHEDAIINSPKLKPVVIRGMSEIMAEIMGMSGIPTDFEDEMMYVCSVPGNVSGAGILAYPEFYERAKEVAKGSFYILPSSIHEVIIVPVATCEVGADDLRSMVKEINVTQVEPNE